MKDILKIKVIIFTISMFGSLWAQPESIVRPIIQGVDDAGPLPVDCQFSTEHNEIYFGQCDNGQEIVSGFRFQDIQVVGPDEIENAHIEFTVDGPYTIPVTIRFYGESTDHSDTFSDDSKPSDRAMTTQVVDWAINDEWQWETKRKSPDLTLVLKEIVGRPGWRSGNAISIIVKNVNSNNTHRRVFGFEREMSSAKTAKLVINEEMPEPILANDLEAMYIERNPKYPRYHALYEAPTIFADDWVPYQISVPKGLGGGQTSSTQRWPNPGETATFIAHVINHGTNLQSGFSYQWYLDGNLVASASSNKTLAAYDTVQLAWSRSWDNNRHTIKFVILDTDDRPSNNTLEDFTDALSFCTFIERGHDAKFAAESLALPQAITTSEIEWFQLHARRLNEMFASAGSHARVRYDRLELIADGTPVPPGDSDDRYVYDGNFPEVVRATHSTLRASGYYDPADDLDYGLLHEQGHQLGLIDLYRMNVDPSQNPVTSAPYATVRCLMNGVDHFFSAHSALAMNSWHGFRRGYFGTYLYDVPEQNYLRIVGTDGQPLSAATISIYQKITTPDGQETIATQLKFTGTTDANGRYLLPNVNIDVSGFVKTETGNIPRPNPFGYISLLGENGVFLIRIEKDGFCDYQWLDITRFNVAYWQGDAAEATYDIPNNLASDFEEVPPLDLAESTANGWSAASADAASNNVTFDENRKLFGQNSVRLETTSGFDVWLRYPGNKTARWDLTQKDSLRVWFYAENPSPAGFQNNSAWFRLINAKCDGGYIEYKPTSELLNEARNQWKYFAISLVGNATWQRTDYGSVSLSEIHSLEIHADTWDAGFTLWVDGLSFDHLPTSVENAQVNEASPQSVALWQNRPNPSNPETVIEYQLPRAAEVEISIFNLQGQKVTTLVRKHQVAGAHKIIWNGTDESGRHVASGIYLYQLKVVDPASGGTGKFVQVKKMLLLR